MRNAITLAASAALFVSAPATAATLIFEFSTNEPFAGGNVSFTLEADAPLPSGTFIQNTALTSFSPGIARIRFQEACFTFVPGQSSTVACDVVEVIVNTGFGTTQVIRLLQDGALSRIGSYMSVNPSSTPATMLVSAAAAAVPEPATWSLMILGFGVVGSAMRRRCATKATVRLA